MGHRIIQQLEHHLQENPDPNPKLRLLSQVFIDQSGMPYFAPQRGVPRRVHEKALAEALRSFMDMPWDDDGQPLVTMPDGSIPPKV